MQPRPRAGSAGVPEPGGYATSMAWLPTLASGDRPWGCLRGAHRRSRTRRRRVGSAPTAGGRAGPFAARPRWAPRRAIRWCAPAASAPWASGRARPLPRDARGAGRGARAPGSRPPRSRREAPRRTDTRPLERRAAARAREWPESFAHRGERAVRSQRAARAQSSRRRRAPARTRRGDARSPLGGSLGEAQGPARTSAARCTGRLLTQPGVQRDTPARYRCGRPARAPVSRASRPTRADARRGRARGRPETTWGASRSRSLAHGWASPDARLRSRLPAPRGTCL